MLLHTATANGFQMVTSGAQSKAVSDWLITSVEVSSHDSGVGSRLVDSYRKAPSAGDQAVRTWGSKR